MQSFGAKGGRLEDERMLKGRGRYVSDWSFPQQAHAHFLRSDRPHARIVSIDAGAALRDAGRHRGAHRGGRGGGRRAGLARGRAGQGTRRFRAAQGAPPCAGAGQGAPRRRAGGAGDRRVAPTGAGCGRGRAGRVRGPAGGDRGAGGHRPGRSAAARQHPRQSAARLRRRRRGGDQRGIRARGARGVAQRLSHARGRQSDGAARLHRHLRRGGRQLPAVCLHPGRFGDARPDRRRAGRRAGKGARSSRRRSAAVSACASTPIPNIARC